MYVYQDPRGSGIPGVPEWFNPCRSINANASYQQIELMQREHLMRFSTHLL